MWQDYWQKRRKDFWSGPAVISARAIFKYIDKNCRKSSLAKTGPAGPAPTPMIGGFSVCFIVCLWMLNLNLVQFLLFIQCHWLYGKGKQKFMGYLKPYVYVVSMPIVTKTSGHTMPLHKANTPHCMVTWLNVDWYTEWTILFLLTLSVRIAGNNVKCNLMTRVVES